MPFLCVLEWAYSEIIQIHTSVLINHFLPNVIRLQYVGVEEGWRGSMSSVLSF